MPHREVYLRRYATQGSVPTGVPTRVYYLPTMVPTRVYTIPPTMLSQVHPVQLVHPAHARRYPVDAAVRGDDALGSNLGLIRETRRIEAPSSSKV